MLCSIDVRRRRVRLEGLVLAFRRGLHALRKPTAQPAVAERAVADNPFGTRRCDGTGDGVEILVAEVQVSQVLCDGPFPWLRAAPTYAASGFSMDTGRNLEKLTKVFLVGALVEFTAYGC